MKITIELTDEQAKQLKQWFGVRVLMLEEGTALPRPGDKIINLVVKEIQERESLEDNQLGYAMGLGYDAVDSEH